jgi:hypothetical protein
MAFIAARMSVLRGRPPGVAPGISGSSRVHSASRRSRSGILGAPSASYEAFTTRNNHRQNEVITGSETDVCVLGTVLGRWTPDTASAICSSSDEGRDALMEVYHWRFSEQIETANADEILDVWS